MSDATEAEPEPRRSRVAGWFSALVPRTVPGCAAVLTWLFLVVLVTVVWVIFFRDPMHVAWRHSVGWSRILGVIVLVFLIPVMLHRALRMWLEGDRSLYPEVDEAWRAGIHALEDQGLEIQNMAVYLILGSRGIGQERAMMQTGQLELRVERVPDGPAPIHWYATAEAVYLFCSDACWSSALATLRQRDYEEHGGISVSQRVRLQQHAPRSPVATGGGSNPGPTTQVSETVNLDQFVDPHQAAAADSAPAPSGSALTGTVRLDEPVPVQPAETPDEVFGDTGSQRRPLTIHSKESTVRLGRLTYLCESIRRVRESTSPIQGILSLIPFDAIESGEGDAEAYEQAIESDLAVIHETLQLRCPITALVTDMERQSGFRELMRRVGRDRVSAQRFGRKFDCRTLATEDQMTALCEHVCGTFEDWVYALFREDQASSLSGNQKLYHLLCQIRFTLKGRLLLMLQGAFAFDPEHGSEEDARLFSGCYFAATGDRADHRAFIGGIFSKLDAEQELVEWTGEAMREETRNERIAAAGLMAAFILAILLIVQTVW